MKKVVTIALSFIAAVIIFIGVIEPANLKDQISFGAQMAKSGNWNEAIYRWQRALESEPENFKVHNNLAVAYEALGKFEEAEKSYKNALKYSKNNREVKENYNLFTKFYAQYGNIEKDSEEKAMDRGDSPATPHH